MSNLNGLDGTYGTGYPSQNYNQYASQYGQPQLPPLITNKLFVNSLEEAMTRQVPPNSDAVYFDKNKDLLYNIITDAWNNKTYVVVELKKVESSITNQNRLEDEIAKLKETLNTLLNKENQNG